MDTELIEELLWNHRNGCILKVSIITSFNIALHLVLQYKKMCL